MLFLCSCGDAQTSSAKNIVKKELKSSFGIVKFDDNITGFKFTTMIGTKFVFSPKGEEDLKNENPTSGFYIQPLKGMGEEEASSHLGDFSSQFSEQEIYKGSENYAVKMITVNLHKATIVSFNVTEKNGSKTFCTHCIMSNGENAIMFIGTDYESGIYAEKFINTFKSIEL